MSSSALTIYTGNGGVRDDSAVPYTGTARVTERCPFVGLSNQGATCYMNSLLQTLFMTPEFRRALYTWRYDEQRDGTRAQCIALQLQRLFGLLQLSCTRSIDTVALTKSFGWEGSEVFQQQDVQELCRVLFDAIEDTFRGTEVDNMIDNLYAGELVDYLKCVGVDYQSDRRDKFLDYSLAITPFGSDVAMHSLHECVEHFLEPEILDGDNQYFVESAGRKADAIKGLKFGRLPQIMSVQLKRFVYDFSGETIVNKKINEEVRFPFLLDLNKYVSSSGGDGSDAFESFLEERIQRLRGKRRSSSAGSSEMVAGAPPDYEDSCEHKIQHKIPDMPDLVDSEGNLCPELLADRLVAAVEESDEERFMRRCYSADEVDRFSHEELQGLIQRNGPWIYELFAVMIHSGAITGGHYYAYVQDLSTKKWYDFDDSRVSELERKKVKEAWGGNISVPVTYSTSYYGTTATSQSTKFQSSANAYMLMYRRIKAGIDDNVSLPSDDEVPEYIRDELKKLEEEETAKKKQDEERFNKLVVKIIWDEKEYTITTNRKKTYVEFLTQLWDELNVINSPSLEDWKESHPPGMLAGDDNKRKEESVVSAFVRPSYIPFDRIRLRHYNSHLKVSQDIHDVETKGEYTLQMLQILDYRALSLQCRSLNEMWDVYIQNGVNLVAMIYDPVTDAFMPPKNVRMRRNDPVLSLKESLRHFVDYDISEMRLLKLSALGVSDIRKEELSDDFAELELRCRVYEGTKIYVENKNKYVIDQSPSLSCFIKSINTITVNISTIGKTHFDLKLVVDRRITFEEFRKRIAKDINMEPNTFRIHRHIVKGQELQYAGNETLQMVGVYDGASLALSEGTPLKPGFSSLAIVLFDNKCAGGIQNLTDLALDEAIAKYSSPANADSEVGAGADIEYEDSIVVAESAWSPARKSEGSSTLSSAVDAVPLSLPELVVQKSSKGSKQLTSFAREDCAAMEDTVTETEGIDGDITEAFVLSPTTSMTVLSRAISGEGSAAAAADDDDDKVETVPIDETVHTDVSSTGSAVECTVDALQVTNEENDDEHMYGYRKVEMTVLNDQFSPLMKVVVESTYLVSDLRKDILEKLIEIGTLPEGSPVGLIRLREKWSARVGGILRDGLTLRQHNVSLVEGREIAVQILSEPTLHDIPTCHQPIQGDCILLIQRWCRTTRTLGEKMEVYIPGSWPVFAIIACLAELVKIKDYRKMEVLIVQPHHVVPISLLSEKTPLDGRRWINVSSAKSRLYDMQWYLTNGDLLLLQDPSEPLRELSEKEKMSVVRAREVDARSYYGASTGSDFLWPEESVSAAAKIVRPANRSVGIHIRKHNNVDPKEGQTEVISATEGDVCQGDFVDRTGGHSPTGMGDISGHDHDKSRGSDDVNSFMML